MKGITKKALLVVALAGVLALPAQPTLASHRPRILSIGEETGNSVALTVQFKERKNDRVVIRVRVEDEAHDRVTLRFFEAKLNSDGKAKVMIHGLNPRTRYEFRVKVRKSTLSRFTEYSRKERAKTADGTLFEDPKTFGSPEGGA